MRTLTAEQVRNSNATVVDVREYPEHATGVIEGARLVPAGQVAAQASAWPKGEPLVLVCKSGRRAAKAAETLQGLGFQEVAVLDGGMDAWKASGYPVQGKSGGPWSLERQVRVAAGSLVVGFSALGLTVSPKFFAGAAAVGAGLVFAGVSDTCMMGMALAKMPWNQAKPA